MWSFNGCSFQGIWYIYHKYPFYPRSSAEPVIFFPYNSFEDLSFAVESSFIFATQLCSFSCRRTIKINYFLEGFIKRTISVNIYRKYVNEEGKLFVELIHNYLQSRCGVRILLQWYYVNVTEFKEARSGSTLT